MKYGSKANLSTKAAPISQNWQKLEIVQNAKSCSKRKKVARNTRSCQKVAEQLVESPTSRPLCSLWTEVSRGEKCLPTLGRRLVYKRETCLAKL